MFKVKGKVFAMAILAVAVMAGMANAEQWAKTYGGVRLGHMGFRFLHPADQ